MKIQLAMMGVDMSCTADSNAGIQVKTSLIILGTGSILLYYNAAHRSFF